MLPFVLLSFILLFSFLSFFSLSLPRSFGMIISSATNVWYQIEGPSIILFFFHNIPQTILHGLSFCLSSLHCIAFWCFYCWWLILGHVCGFFCLFLCFSCYMLICLQDCSVIVLLSILHLSISLHNVCMNCCIFSFNILQLHSYF